MAHGDIMRRKPFAQSRSLHQSIHSVLHWIHGRLQRTVKTRSHRVPPVVRTDKLQSPMRGGMSCDTPPNEAFPWPESEDMAKATSVNVAQ